MTLGAAPPSGTYTIIIFNGERQPKFIYLFCVKYNNDLQVISKVDYQFIFGLERLFMC
jgi:hypothetical protein